MAFEKVLQAIEDIKNGKMVVMVDAEDRENEGDLVCAASFCDMEKVNFMITHAKGVLCTPLTKDIAKDFELDPMIQSNTSAHETAFTVSIDGAQTTTGVSAYERNLTIKMLVNPNTKASDFVRPGHIFPLIAKEGGVLERTGHTEGSVDLCKLAGLAPVSVICEIVKEDGTMARRDDLLEFCKIHNLNMVSIADLIEYRLKHEKLITVNEGENTKIADFKAKKFMIKDHLNNNHQVFVFGEELKEIVNVKFHQISSDLDFLTGEKYESFMKYLEILNKEGGILIFLDSKNQMSDEFKNYGIGAQILKHFKIEKMNLLSSSKRSLPALDGFGLEIINYI